MKKKLLSLALALVMCLFLLPATALALSDEEIRKMAEELAPYLPDMTVEEIINTLNKEVTPEQDKAFQDALESLYPEFLVEDSVLTGYYGDSSTVIIPDTVTSIGHDAFHDCTELTSVTIPKSLFNILRNASWRGNFPPGEAGFRRNNCVYFKRSQRSMAEKDLPNGVLRDVKQALTV